MRTIEITAKYTPVEWGVITVGKKTQAWVKYKRIGKNYKIYGDDADMYEMFEKEGFRISKKVSSRKEADKWLKEML